VKRFSYPDPQGFKILSWEADKSLKKMDLKLPSAILNLAQFLLLKSVYASSKILHHWPAYHLNRVENRASLLCPDPTTFNKSWSIQERSSY
jgi:hypothetical protein